VKLYSYSSEILTFVEVKWTLAKFAIGGILFGIVILFGVIKLNQFVGDTLGAHSANTLTSENNFLRQQVSLISQQVNKLEMQARQLNERGDKLHMLLDRRKIVGDMGSSFANATKGVQAPIFYFGGEKFQP
jgi:hypothetical protein